MKAACGHVLQAAFLFCELALIPFFYGRRWAIIAHRKSEPLQERRQPRKARRQKMEGLSKQERLAAQQRLNRWQLRINGPIVAATGVLLLWMRNEKLTGAITLLCGVTAFGLSFILFRNSNNDNRTSSGQADHRSGPENPD